MQYVIDRTRGGRKETPAELPRSRARQPGARRRGDAGERRPRQGLCGSTGATKACRCCSRWDGRSDPDSVGTHIFEEFISRVPPDGALWEVPFSADDPLNTPRDLNETDPRVMQAMTDAIAYLQQHKVPVRRAPGARCRWPATAARRRSRSAAALGDAAGNANALASRNPIAEHREVPADHLRLLAHPGDLVPARRPDVDARTILTYSQDENPRRRSRRTRRGCSRGGSGCGSPGRDAQIARAGPGHPLTVLVWDRSAGAGHVAELGVVGVVQPAAGGLLVDVGDAGTATTVAPTMATPRSTKPMV